MTNEEAVEYLIDIPRSYGVRRDDAPCNAINIAINSIQENTKLKAENEQLKSKLEQSVKLPCKLKDTVYEVVKCDDGVTRIFEMKICNVCEYGSFHNGSKKKFVWNIYMEDEKGFGYSYGTFYDFGKTIFLSLKEAEQSLKGQV